MTNQLKHLIKSIFFMYNWDYWVLVLFLLAVSVIYIAIKKLISNKKISNSIIIISFVIYFCLMIYTALIDRNASIDSSGYCLIPFYSYYQFFNGNRDIMQQSFMNIAFFYPVGFLLSCLDMGFVKKSKWVIVVFAFVFSFCIEALQYIFHLGYAEVDDLIHNTLGTVIGILVFAFLNKLFDKKLLHNRKNN